MLKLYLLLMLQQMFHRLLAILCVLLYNNQQFYLFQKEMAKQIAELKKHLKLLSEAIDMFPAISLRETTYRDKAKWAWNEIALLLIQIAGE
jgi:hypothetical protein